MTHALDLPEVRGHITQFMSPHDLTVCMRVSREWNHTCRPLLWRKLDIVWYSPIGRVLRKAFIHHHSDLVKSLNCGESFDDASKTVASVVSDIYFQNLETLTWSAPTQDQTAFTYCHRLTLVYLDLSYEGGRLMQRRESEELWRVIAACPKLKTLKISRVSVTHATWPVCWSLWSRLEALHLCHIDFSPLVSAGDSDRSRKLGPGAQYTSLSEYFANVYGPCQQPLVIKTLSLTNNRYLEPEDELVILKYCPDLENLSWMTNNQYNSNQFGQLLAEQARHCFKLVSLHLLCCGSRPGNNVASFLETKVGVPLQELSLPSSIFGQDVWDLVRTKHDSLRSLNLWHAVVPKGLAHNILCNLPANIESLSVGSLEDRDLLDDPRPWVCPSLTSLSLGLGVDDGVKGQRLIMKQLATLTSLKHLKVLPHAGAFQREILHFRLRSGLGQLATLHELRKLEFHSQSLTEDDVRWMVDNWPRLSSVFGPLHPKPAKNSLLGKILTERGVMTRAPNYSVQVRLASSLCSSLP